MTPFLCDNSWPCFSLLHKKFTTETGWAPSPDSSVCPQFDQTPPMQCTVMWGCCPPPSLSPLTCPQSLHGQRLLSPQSSVPSPQSSVFSPRSSVTGFSVIQSPIMTLERTRQNSTETKSGSFYRQYSWMTLQPDPFLVIRLPQMLLDNNTPTLEWL